MAGWRPHDVTVQSRRRPSTASVAARGRSRSRMTFLWMSSRGFRGAHSFASAPEIEVSPRFRSSLAQRSSNGTAGRCPASRHASDATRREVAATARCSGPSADTGSWPERDREKSAEDWRKRVGVEGTWNAPPKSCHDSSCRQGVAVCSCICPCSWTSLWFRSHRLGARRFPRSADSSIRARGH